MIVGRKVYQHKRRLIGSVSNASLLVCGFFSKNFFIDFLYIYICIINFAARLVYRAGQEGRAAPRLVRNEHKVRGARSAATTHHWSLISTLKTWGGGGDF